MGQKTDQLATDLNDLKATVDTVLQTVTTEVTNMQAQIDELKASADPITAEDLAGLESSIAKLKTLVTTTPPASN